MSIDLLDQLAEYGADHRARQAPVEQHEILARVRELDERLEEPLDETRRTRSIMLVAAAAVVAIVAGLALFSGRDPSEPADVPGTDLIDMVETTLPSTSIDPSPTTSSSTTSTTTPSTGTGTTDEQAAPVPQPAVMAPRLAAPVNGETQESIVGDITWTRIEGDITTFPSDVVFELDGVFYGHRLSDGGGDDAGPQPRWWRSPDGVSWAEWDDVPPFAELTVAGGTIWATSSGPTSDGAPALRYWDGNGFVTVELPPSGEAPGEGLTARSVWLTIAAEDQGGIVVERTELFGVPWEELLGIEPPLQAVGEGGSSWAGAFRVEEAECTRDGPYSFGCRVDGELRTWRIRPQIVDGTPTRIDLYDDATGLLITSIAPPDDRRPIGEVLRGLAAENSVGTRTDNFVVDRDGSDARPIDSSFGPRPGFVELGGRRYVLIDANGGEQQLLVSEGEGTWEELAVPSGVDQDGYSRLTSDGSTMILTTFGPHRSGGLLSTNHPMWITTDGVSWTPWESPLTGHPAGGVEPADFGWIDSHDAHADPEASPEAPLLAVSPDAETWQAIPIPVPDALADQGLTWANRETDDGLGEWHWQAYAHGDAVFIALSPSAFDGAELWIGRVTTQ